MPGALLAVVVGQQQRLLEPADDAAQPDAQQARVQIVSMWKGMPVPAHFGQGAGNCDGLRVASGSSSI